MSDDDALIFEEYINREMILDMIELDAQSINCAIVGMADVAKQMADAINSFAAACAQIDMRDILD